MNNYYIPLIGAGSVYIASFFTSIRYPLEKSLFVLTALAIHRLAVLSAIKYLAYNVFKLDKAPIDRFFEKEPKVALVALHAGSMAIATAMTQKIFNIALSQYPHLPLHSSFLLKYKKGCAVTVLTGLFASWLTLELNKA